MSSVNSLNFTCERYYIRESKAGNEAIMKHGIALGDPDDVSG
jgi:hypothetical protein